MLRFRTTCATGFTALLLLAGAGCTGTTADEPESDGGGPGARPLADGAPLKLGLMFSSDEQETVQQAGGKSKYADRQVIHRALLDYVNRNGGIAGHEVEAAEYDFPAAATSQEISQGACTQWTQDDHVFAALPSASAEDNRVLRECLSEAGVVSMYAGTYSTTREDQFGESPFWFEADTLPLEVWAKVYAEGLAEQGFFDGAKVGVVYDQYPEYSAVAKDVLMPALRDAGADVVSSFAGNVHSVAELSSGATEMNNAVLKFRDEGVTNVLFFNAWAPAWILFSQAAAQQGWTPLYGLSSQDVPQASFATGLVPPDQMVGARLVGWNSTYDVPPPDGASWARQEECRSIFSEAKLDIGSFGAETYGPSIAECGALLMLRDAGTLVEGALTPASLARAVEALGEDLQSASAPDARFTSDRHYGPASWRPAAYDASCSCFEYTADPTGF